jgi:hypothetical protein
MSSKFTDAVAAWALLFISGSASASQLDHERAAMQRRSAHVLMKQRHPAAAGPSRSCISIFSSRRKTAAVTAAFRKPPSSAAVIIGAKKNSVDQRM